ncbi:decarboxylating NADP(+)-dependent phosphogluconate dehydrogenase [Chlamydiifrater phoenicopteri]|uniref:decarboxylating NADP(+)-dependent phosphogluconate dehydrogenase n=1 Tax=Chlamydiifrater phoenicopteri TaxID=2681469 RepID=UPI001BD01ACC|nr:decarboxylating NADP(+)-dependent phosphogluconate dehydrogenase [Chlamydiifrater phoenicopteri]
MTKGSDIGLIGLAVMGKNLVLNMRDHGFSVSVYNRSQEKTQEFLQEPEVLGSTIRGFYSLQDFISSLERPRKVLLMIKSGDPVDRTIDAMLPFLEKGDIIIDGGNSYFLDSERRYKYLQDKGILFVGAGISGGEEGARFGPSIMPGGDFRAWKSIEPIFLSIAAKSQDGKPCCSWIGSGGAGHYVKMVHNGIEYGDMQLISELYGLMRDYVGMSSEEIALTFSDWNKQELESFLVRITSEVLKAKNENNQPIIDSILDVAGQKGTGKWTALEALQMDVPLSLITGSVFSRYLSGMKEERVEAHKLFQKSKVEFSGSKKDFLQDCFQALYASKIISYSQGFSLLKQASMKFDWNLDLGEISLIWRGGCIIQSVFLQDIKDAFVSDPNLSSLVVAPFFVKALAFADKGWRRVVSSAVLAGVSIPCLSEAIAYFDGYTTAKSSINLIQGLRDYFGAHSYERTDRPRGEFYHTDWSGSMETKLV